MFSVTLGHHIAAYLIKLLVNTAHYKMESIIKKNLIYQELNQETPERQISAIKGFRGWSRESQRTGCPHLSRNKKTGGISVETAE